MGVTSCATLPFLPGTHVFSTVFKLLQANSTLFKHLWLVTLEMGHRSSSLLRERYLNMEGVSRDRARLFWEAPEHGWNNKTGIAGTDFL